MRTTPRQVQLTITKAMRRALIATHDQQIFRLYTKDGSVMKSEKPGIASRTLWTLLALRMIEDEPKTKSGGIVIKCRMRLTRAGTAVLGKST